MSIELEHSFDVPIPPEQAWEVLLDVKRVAPCMPGATVDEVDGDEVTGRIKVKVGPIALTYAGKARFTERDPVTHAVTVVASGKETKGAGTASATVHARLDDNDGQTTVVVRTSLNVTGRPAQFGRGVMSEVAGRLVEKFSANLAEQLASGSGSEPEPAIPNGVLPDTRLALPIEELNLPTRSYNSLKNEGIETVGELVARSPSDLLAIRNLGAKSVGEIEERLTDLGLALKDAASAPTASPNGQSAANGAGRAMQAGEAAPAGTAGEATGFAASDADAAMRRDEPEDDALNLFDVAAGPVLKRVLPALAALVALIWLGSRVRLRSRRHGSG
jgi:carbon monoxide dehydrogenase subunit G